MKLSLIRFGGGGDADVPAHIREQMAKSWYVRNFNSFTTRGRANTVIGVVTGWVLFGFAMSRWSKSRKAKNPPVEHHPPPRPSSSAKKTAHH